MRARHLARDQRRSSSEGRRCPRCDADTAPVPRPWSRTSSAPTHRPRPARSRSEAAPFREAHNGCGGPRAGAGREKMGHGEGQATGPPAAATPPPAVVWAGRLHGDRPPHRSRLVTHFRREPREHGSQIENPSSRATQRTREDGLNPDRMRGQPSTCATSAARAKMPAATENSSADPSCQRRHAGKTIQGRVPHDVVGGKVAPGWAEVVGKSGWWVGESAPPPFLRSRQPGVPLLVVGFRLCFCASGAKERTCAHG